MKRILISSVAKATLAMALVPAHAATDVTNNFNVSVTLSSQCVMTTATTPTIAFGTYTAFGAAIGPIALSAPLTFKCTHKLPNPTVAFDTINGAANGSGVIAGLAYTLSLPALIRTDGSDATTSAAATQDTLSYTFTGSMAGNQSGECAGASCTPLAQARQLIVSY
jgi:hypothetical protein